MEDLGGLLGSVAHGVLQGFGGPLGGISQGIQAHELQGLMAGGMGAGQLGMHMQGMPGQQRAGLGLLGANQAQQRTHLMRRNQNAPPAPMKMTTQLQHLKAVQEEARPVAMMVQGMQTTNDLAGLVEANGSAGIFSPELAGQYKAMLQQIANARAWADNPMDTEKAAAASKEMLESLGGDDALSGMNFGTMQSKQVQGFIKESRARFATGAAEGIQRMSSIARLAPNQEQAWNEYTRTKRSYDEADIRNRQRDALERKRNGG